MLISAVRAQAVSQMISEIQACPSAYVLNRLSSLQSAPNLPPEAARQIPLAIAGANVLNVHYDPVSGTISFSPPKTWTQQPSIGPPAIDNCHSYALKGESPDGTLAPYFSYEMVSPSR